LVRALLVGVLDPLDAHPRINELAVPGQLSAQLFAGHGRELVPVVGDASGPACDPAMLQAARDAPVELVELIGVRELANLVTERVARIVALTVEQRDAAGAMGVE